MNRVRRERRSGKAAIGRGSQVKRQLDQIPASSYDDAEEALEAGTELEEKAERFSIGDKARKYYLLALEVYQRCLQLDDGNANAAYNAARVLFILGTSFSIPIESIESLRGACDAYRLALSLTSPLESDGATPSAFYLDIEYNLAIALLQLSEQHDRISSANENLVTQLLQDAMTSFWNVLQGQQTVLRWQRQHESQSVQTAADSSPLVADPATSGKEEDVQDDFTVSPVTPASVLETVSSLHSAGCTLIEASGSIGIQSKALETCNIAHTLAQEVFLSYPDAADRCGEVEWAEQQAGLRFANLELRIVGLGVFDGKGIEETLALANSNAEELLSPTSGGVHDLSSTLGRALHQIRLQHCHQLGDHLLTLARVCLGQIAEQNLAEKIELVKVTWQLLTQSSKLLLGATKLIDEKGVGQTSSVAVIGSERVISSAMRRRSALFVGLSTISALRSASIFTTSGFVDGIEAKTGRTLLDNARVYARKALAEVGLTSMIQNVQQTPRYKAPHGGLDNLCSEVDAVLALFNALALRRSIAELCESVAVETRVLCANLKLAILAHTDRSVADVWKVCMGLRNGGMSDDRQGLFKQAVMGTESMVYYSRSEKEYFEHVEDMLSTVN